MKRTKNFLRCVCFVLLLSLVSCFSFTTITGISPIVQTNAINMSETSITLQTGQTKQLTLEGATSDVTWRSLSPQIASVSDTGLVKAIGRGTAIISATSDKKVYMCVVNVTQSVESIQLNETDVTMKSGDIMYLYGTCLPITATNTTLSYSSSNPNVVSVDNGIVIAQSSGSATIYAKATDGSGVTATCKVTVTPKLSSLRFDSETLNLGVGESTEIGYEYFPKTWTEGFTWKSSDPNVLSVDQEGEVTGKKTGKSLVTLSASDGSRSCYKYVYVTQKVEELIVPSSVTMEVGETAPMDVTVKPETLDKDEVLQYSSTTPSVASITSNGVITAKKTGTAILRCKTTDGSNLTKQQVLNVVEKPTETVYVSKVDLDMSEIPNNTMQVGDSATIGVKITPSNATNKNLTWTSSNTSVATIDSDGNIIARGSGSTVIRATSTDGYGINDSETVTVVQPAVLIMISGPSSIAKTETAQLSTTMIPSGANEPVKWSSSDPSIVSVNSNGKITGKSSGSATITCEGEYSGVKATKAIQVTSNSNAITEITLTGDSSMVVDETQYLSYSITPSNATAYKFTSSNSRVATVTMSGLVTAKSAGTTTITCEATDGSGVKATFKITVKNKVTGITLSPSSFTLEKGDTTTLTASIRPTSADTSGLVWSTSDRSIATVNQSGRVTAKSAGVVIVYCKTTDGSVVGSSTGIITEPVTSLTISGSSSVGVGKTIQLTASVSPSNMKDYLEWKSSDTSIAQVSSSGVVTGVKAGKVTIVATCGNKSTQKTITVTSASSTRVDITDSFKYMNKGTEYDMKVSTNGGTVTWKSSNPSVATISKDGHLKCIGNGNVTISATANGVTDELTFTVGDYSSYFRFAFNEIDVNAGGQAILEVRGIYGYPNKIRVEDGSIAKATVSGVTFYDNAVNIQGISEGTTIVTIFNSQGYGCSTTVNVIDSRDTTGVTGLTYDREASDKLFDLINDYRRSTGRSALSYSEKAEDAAIAQVLTGHRMTELDANYDNVQHNSYQLSCYYFTSRVTPEQILTSWQNSSIHNSALLDSTSTVMGVACYKTPFGYCAFMTIGTPTEISYIIS